MKTVDELYNDTWEALLAAKTHLENKGYNARLFTNINGDDTLAVDVMGDDGEEREFVAVFEPV